MVEKILVVVVVVMEKLMVDIRYHRRGRPEK